MSTVAAQEQLPDPYFRAFRGSFSGVLYWPDLDEFWVNLRAQKIKQWFIYPVGEPPPQQPVTPEQFETFIAEIDQLLRHEHKEDYCGVVYADDRQEPTFVKIYDPNNLGVVCGFSENPPLPGWILSNLRPIDLPQALIPPNNRRRWWQKLFGK
jgi:hypothetical protein